MTFERLRTWDWVAFIAALALLFVSATDWWSTRAGDEARTIQKESQPSGAMAGEVDRAVQSEAKFVAQGQEKNAWQTTGVIDRVILIGLLATVLFGVLAAFAAAAGRDPTASTLPAVAAGVTALLVVYRLVQQPGFDESTTVKLGAPLALVVLGVVGFASSKVMRMDPEAEAAAEEAETVAAEPQAAPWDREAHA
jgi:hypothetical protein